MAFLLAFIVLTMNLSNVYANGSLPVYTSAPSGDELLISPIYNTNYHFAVNNSDVDYFYFHNTTNNSNNIVFVCPSAFSVYYYPYNYTVKTDSSYGGQGYYQYSATANGASDVIPFLGDFANTNSACSYALTNGVTYPVPAPVIKSNYQIQNGWLTVIDLGNSGTSYDYDLSTMFNVNSGLVSQDWTETSQVYWFSNALPSAGDTYENIGSLISWERGEPRNIFGQTKYGIFNLSGTSTGRYLFILNPFYRAIADSEHPTVINYPVTIDGLLEGQQAYIYEVTATATVTGIVNAITTTTVDGVSTITNWGTTSGGAISADVTNSFVNSDTDTTTVQNAGGGNSNESAQTINDYLQQIQDVLDSFVTQVLGLLTAPISHIRQLITTGSEFMNTLGGLFTWLPEPVISVVVSALIVMVVIGIFKMFL